MSSFARFDITEAQIESVVRVFYQKVRVDSTLGPIFQAHVTHWPEHEVKIAAFWKNAILKQKTYSGNPMQVHMGVKEIRPDHFGVWLRLFDQVLFQQLPNIAAAQWSNLAHRIGRGLQMGITEQAGGIPTLTG